MFTYIYNKGFISTSWCFPINHYLVDSLYRLFEANRHHIK